MTRSVQSQYLSAEYDRMLEQKQQIEARERAAVEAPLRAEVDRLRAALATAQAERDQLQAHVTRLTSELAFVRNEAAGFNMAWAFALERVESERDTYRAILAGVHGALMDAGRIPVPDMGESLDTAVRALVAERDKAAKRAEYWKAEHLAGNATIIEADEQARTVRAALTEARHQASTLRTAKQEIIDALMAERDAALQRVAEVEAEWGLAVARKDEWEKRVMARETEAQQLREERDAAIADAEDSMARTQRLQQAEAALAQAQAALGPCTWTEQPDEDDFATTCGHAFQFAHDPPYDYVKICCYCGKSVVFVAAPPEKEDHDE